MHSYTFQTALCVAVSFRETLKTGHDEKAILYLNAILKCYFIIYRPCSCRTYSQFNINVNKLRCNYKHVTAIF
jgi:hypothetical protein